MIPAALIQAPDYYASAHLSYMYTGSLNAEDKVTSPIKADAALRPRLLHAHCHWNWEGIEMW